MIAAPNATRCFQPPGRLPTSWCASAFEAGKGQHPPDLLLALTGRYAVDAGKKLEVLLDRKVVVQREFLRHVADSLPHLGRPQTPTFTRKLHLPLRRIEQTAQHLDRRRLARAVGAEQPVDLAVRPPAARHRERRGTSRTSS